MRIYLLCAVQNCSTIIITTRLERAPELSSWIWLQTGTSLELFLWNKLNRFSKSCFNLYNIMCFMMAGSFWPGTKKIVSLAYCVSSTTVCCQPFSHSIWWLEIFCFLSLCKDCITAWIYFISEIFTTVPARSSKVAHSNTF